MFKKDVWYKSPLSDELGMFGGLYTYFKFECYKGDKVRIGVYDFTSNSNFKSPILKIQYEKERLFNASREVSEEEIGESIAYIAKLLLR